MFNDDFHESCLIAWWFLVLCVCVFLYFACQGQVCYPISGGCAVVSFVFLVFLFGKFSGKPVSRKKPDLSQYIRFRSIFWIFGKIAFFAFLKKKRCPKMKKKRIIGKPSILGGFLES